MDYFKYEHSSMDAGDLKISLCFYKDEEGEHFDVLANKRSTGEWVRAMDADAAARYHLFCPRTNDFPLKKFARWLGRKVL